MSGRRTPFRSTKAALTPASVRVVQGFVEPSLAGAAPEVRLQFERHGYFVTDRVDHSLGKPVFNKITGLRDGWTAAK